MAETELSVLTKQGLNRRIADQPTLDSETAAWETSPDAARCRIDWQFTPPKTPPSDSNAFSRQFRPGKPLALEILSNSSAPGELTRSVFTSRIASSIRR